MRIKCQVNYDDPSKLADAALIGAHKLTERNIDYTQWAKSMSNDLGPGVEPHLAGLYDRAQAIHDHFKGGITPKDFSQHTTPPKEVGYNNLLANPKKLSNLAGKLREFLPAEILTPDDRQQVENAVNFFKDNKLAHHQISEQYPWKQGAQYQYNGYNIHSQVLGKKWGFTPWRVALAESALSSGHSPEASFRMAEGIMHVMRTARNFNWTPEMTKEAKSWAAGIKAKNIKYLQGKTFGELTNDLDRAMWIRAYDSTYVDQRVRMIGPDGTLGEYELAPKSRKPTKLAWTSNYYIAQGIKALRDANPSDVLKSHKYGNYFNSKLAAIRRSRDYTVDVHDAAAGLFDSRSGNDPLFAIPGIHQLMKEAGLRAADEVGLDPKVFQAGIWTHQRGGYSMSALKHTGASEKIQQVWKDAHDGKITIADARARVTEIARTALPEPKPPGWFRPGEAGVTSAEGTGNMGELARPVGAEPGRGGFGRTSPLETGVRRSFIEDYLKPAYEKALIAQYNKPIRFYSGIPFDPQSFKNEVIIGAYHLATKSREFYTWSKQIVKDLGDRIKPYLQDLYQASQKYLDEHTAATAEKRNAAFITRKEKGTAELQQRIKERNISPRRMTMPYELSDAAREAQARYDKAFADYQRLIDKIELQHKPLLGRIADTMVNFGVAAKMFTATTGGKLASAVGQRGLQNLMEEQVGRLMKYSPLYPLTRLAPTEGAPSIGASLAGAKGFAKGIARAPSYILGRREGPLMETAKQRRSPLIRFATGWHGAIKSPALHAGIERALVKAERAARFRGEDIGKPDVARNVIEQAKEYGQRQILVNRNAATSIWNAALRRAESSDTALGRNIGRGMRTLVPVTKVPVNLAIELGHMSSAGVPGIAKAISLLPRVIRYGLKSVRPEEADFVMRNIKKGAVGTAIFALGYFNPQSVGGIYQQGHKQKPGQPRWGEAVLFGQRVPWWMMHSPIAMMLQLGATVRHYQDEKGTSFAQAYLNMPEYIMKEIPFLTAGSDFNNLINASSREGTYQRGRLAQGYIPGVVRNIAQSTDTVPKRYPQNTLQYIESVIPGLQSNVPAAPQKRSRH